MTPTDYTRLQQDYAQACEVIAQQAEKLGELRRVVQMALEWHRCESGVDQFRAKWGVPDGMPCIGHIETLARNAGAIGSTPLVAEINEIQRIEAILKGGSTPPASGSTPATTPLPDPTHIDPEDGC